MVALLYQLDPGSFAVRGSPIYILQYHFKCLHELELTIWPVIIIYVTGIMISVRVFIPQPSNWIILLGCSVPGE